MKTKNRRHLLWLTLYAIAMAQVEASVVVHLRSVYYPGHPLALFPLSLLSQRDLGIELIREAATVVMIFTVALIAERGFTRVFAAFVYIFGMWDIFYYAWLKLMIGWPVDWFEWDILFLIPWPWFGPWITPVLIALLFVFWGIKVLTSPREYHISLLSGSIFFVGTLLALAAFLLPAYPLLAGGGDAFRNYRPQGFNWLLYGPGFLLMAYGLWGIARKGDIRL
jgi:hypothetical protein